jgi:Zn-dependent peptidase ImmA (M78 family)
MWSAPDGAVVVVDNFNPDMLKLARDAREVTQAELAMQTGLSQALISKMEHGLISEPGSEAIAVIANELRFPEHFFFQQERAVGFPHFHYRKRAKLGAKALARIGALLNIKKQHVSKLLRSYEQQPLKPIPQIDLDEFGLTPDRVAERVRAFWMIPRGPVQNIVEIIEQAGGIVVNVSFGTNLMDGISFRSEGLPPIFVMNKDVPGDRYRFSLAHELGHMIMHGLPEDDEKMEDEAHRFAAAFLMPADDIRPYLSSPKLNSLGRVKAFWRVSIKALIRRSNDLNLITPYQYKSLNIEYSRAFKGGEPVPVQIEKPTRLQSIVIYHKESLGYSLQDLGTMLAAHPDEIENEYYGEKRGLRLIVSN